MNRSIVKLAMCFALLSLGCHPGCESRKQLSPTGVESELQEQSSVTAPRRISQIKQWLADLEAPDPSARRVAAESLKSLSAEDVGAVPVLVGGLDSSNDNVRLFSAHALGSIGEPARAAVQPLIDASLKAGGDWQFVALSVIKIMQGDPSAEEAVAASYRSATGDAKYRMLWIAAELDPPAKSLNAVFVDELNSPNPRAREKACFALARLGKQDFLPYIGRITELFVDEDTEVRKMAISAVSSAAPQATEAIDPLGQLLRDSDPEIQRASALALAAFGENAADFSEQLVGFVESQDRDLRIAALVAIGQIGMPASGFVDRLALGIQDPDEKIRQLTVQALIHIAPDHEKTIQGITAALKENSELNRGFVLSTIGDRVQEPAPAIFDRLLECLEDPRELTRINAMEALLKLSGRSNNVRKSMIEQFNGSDRAQEALRTEAMISVVRRNQEYTKIGLQDRAQEVLDAFGGLRVEASKRVGSAADRMTKAVADKNRYSDPS